MLRTEVTVAETAVSDDRLELALAGIFGLLLIVASWLLGHAAADR